MQQQQACKDIDHVLRLNYNNFVKRVPRRPLTVLLADVRSILVVLRRELSFYSCRVVVLLMFYAEGSSTSTYSGTRMFFYSFTVRHFGRLKSL